jgi:hypothetical protein
MGFIRSWNPEENHHGDFSVAVSRLTRNDIFLANVCPFFTRSQDL